MNYGIIAKTIGYILIFEAVMFLPPIIVGAIYQESSAIYFVGMMVLTLLIGAVLSLGTKPAKKIRAKEAVVIVAGGWLAVAFFGALPFYLSGAIPSLMDAFFETVSGLTTTGATVIEDIESLDRTLLFWRSFTHWLGGMGILVLALAVLPSLGLGSIRVFRAETPGPVSEKLAPKMRQTAVILYTAYLGMTLLQTGLLLLGGLTLYEALVHTFGTVGTGGFSIYNDSIGAYSSGYVQWIIAVFMVAAGVNFSLYYAAYRKRPRELFGNEELRFYLLIIGASTLFVFFNIQNATGLPLWTSLRHAFFQVSSIVTTTGYTTVDYELWPAFSQNVLFFLMFVGGCAGSTGGSMKVIRLLVMIRVVKHEVLRILHPRAVMPVRVQKHTLDQEVMTSVVAFYMLYILIISFGAVMLSLEGLDLVSSISTVAATLGNIGPGFGVVGPLQNYASFSDPAKGLLSLFMLMGRLELFTVFILMTPDFWSRKN